ncbi:MAG TPA: beta-ketoacyl-ACP synthase III [bacterium]|nr:beta-ketoacyl-ACP synthase III [bacterium]
MRNSTIIGTGFYVPPWVVTNDDLSKLMDTSDEWIRERTGIRERRWAEAGVGPADMAKIAAEQAIADAGLQPEDIQMIVFATLNPDVFFPGSGCILQSKWPVFGTIPAIDVREQCSGFIYAVAVADRFIRTEFCDNVLVIGAENHSCGLDLSNRGRDVSVIFGDGAGAVVMVPAASNGEGVFDFSLHCQGEYYDKLWLPAPAANRKPRVSYEMIDSGDIYPKMDGRAVFRHAVPRFSEAMNEVLQKTGRKIEEVDLFIPHQANERISRMVADKMGLPWEKVVSNIHKFGNTTAATIPICMCEARADGRLKKGGLLLCAAFGSGFTWGAFLMKWTI